MGDVSGVGWGGGGVGGACGQRGATRPVGASLAGGWTLDQPRRCCRAVMTGRSPATGTTINHEHCMITAGAQLMAHVLALVCHYVTTGHLRRRVS